MKRKCFTLALVLLIALTNSALAELTHVAISMGDSANARQIAIAQDILAHMDRDAFEVQFRDAGGRQSQQIQDIEELLEENPDYIIISSTKAIGLGSIIHEAADQGVGIIMVESFSTDVAAEDILT